MQQRRSLFDHLVGAGEQRGCDGNAAHLRSLEVDDEFELGGELNWQMGDKCAFKYLVYVRCGAMLQIRGYGHFTDDDVADVAQLAMAGLIQQSATPRRLFALPTGCPGDPEQQSRS